MTSISVACTLATYIIWQLYKLINVVNWYLEVKIQWTKAKTLVGQLGLCTSDTVMQLFLFSEENICRDELQNLSLSYVSPLWRDCIPSPGVPPISCMWSFAQVFGYGTLLHNGLVKVKNLFGHCNYILSLRLT